MIGKIFTDEGLDFCLSECPPDIDEARAMECIEWVDMHLYLTLEEQEKNKSKKHEIRLDVLPNGAVIDGDCPDLPPIPDRYLELAPRTEEEKSYCNTMLAFKYEVCTAMAEKAALPNIKTGRKVREAWASRNEKKSKQRQEEHAKYPDFLDEYFSRNPSHCITDARRACAKQFKKTRRTIERHTLNYQIPKK